MEHRAGGIPQSEWGTASAGRDRFPLLKTMEMVLRIVGWLAVAGGVAIWFFNVLPWLICIMDTKSARTVACIAAFAALAPMIGALVVGVCLVAFGEVIGVFRGIEGNTYQMLNTRCSSFLFLIICPAEW